jgi:hypothetical protein
MIDIRKMSPDELTQLNERGREWRAKNSPATAVKDAESAPFPNQVSDSVVLKEPPSPRLEATGQLAFDFGAI